MTIKNVAFQKYLNMKTSHNIMLNKDNVWIKIKYIVQKLNLHSFQKCIFYSYVKNQIFFAAQFVLLYPLLLVFSITSLISSESFGTWPISLRIGYLAL